MNKKIRGQYKIKLNGWDLMYSRNMLQAPLKEEMCILDKLSDLMLMILDFPDDGTKDPAEQLLLVSPATIPELANQVIAIHVLFM